MSLKSTAYRVSILPACCSVLVAALACGTDDDGGDDASQGRGGGASAKGGSASGSSSKGGSSAAGSGASGAPSGGSSGGSVASGGSSSGGASKGGSASGGVTNGGSSSGGAASGGSSSGGSTGNPSNGPCPTDGLLGWAMQGSGTTGGGNAPPQEVTSAGELNSLASGSDPKVIYVSGAISGSLSVGSNKTIIGKGKSAKVGPISINGSNIIIRNLTIKGGGDTISARGSHHIWLDHLDLSDGSDGVVDLTRESDFATVSWNKIYYDRGGGHRLALLFGGGSTHTEDRGKNNHTVHHNWFGKGVDQRMPRLLFGKGHIYNNYYNSPGNTYCVGSGSWASLLVEGNYFKDVNDPHRFQDGNPSFITAKDNFYENVAGKKDAGAGGSGSNPPSAWTPDYQYPLDRAEDIPALVQRCAGPQDNIP